MVVVIQMISCAGSSGGSIKKFRVFQDPEPDRSYNIYRVKNCTVFLSVTPGINLFVSQPDSVLVLSFFHYYLVAVIQDNIILLMGDS